MQQLGTGSTSPAPQPTPAQMRVLRTVGALGGRGVRHADVADSAGGHPNAVRPHLDALTRGGFLTVSEVRSGHRGRPPRVYDMTPAGRTLLTRNPVGDGGALVGALTSFLVDSGHGPDDARRVGEIWGKALDDDAAHRTPPPVVDGVTDDPGVSRVLDVMDSLGFDPDHESTGHGDGHTVTLRSCPMLDLAQANPEFVCRIHEGLITGVLARSGTVAQVRLQTLLDGRTCRIHIEPEAV
ncbi:hypothetical protein EDL96_12115 [Kocuria soli]|uniref:Transcriptional regulator n=1 Tax=Kocuria soli TaxID=2485125 RepID=A0A3N3ZMF4_9MICC|nr:hypothetical protein [Kocuria soli]ROZ61850.1 hypothetical protein EDL96_12115 [Kocuria soli]